MGMGSIFFINVFRVYIISMKLLVFEIGVRIGLDMNGVMWCGLMLG